MSLSALDWIVIAAYFAVTVGIGFLFSGRAGRSLADYFISGRQFPWWVAGTSMVATTFAADTPLAVTALVAKNGLAGNWFWWSFALGGMFTVFVYARLWRRADVLTDVELVELRYGGRPAAFLRGFRSIYVALLVNSIVIGWVCGAMIDVLQYTVLYAPDMLTADELRRSLMQWMNSLYDPAAAAPENTDAMFAQLTREWTILLVMLAAVGAYSAASGLWGVAVADMLQFVLAMGGCIALAALAVNHVGGIDQLQTKLAATFESGDQATAYLPNFTAENAWMPLKVFLVLLFVQWWATWYPGAEPGGGGYVVQRMSACRTERDSLLATLWYQIAHYCVRPWPWILVAFVALAMYPELRTDENPGKGFPIVIREVAPPGLRGLMLVTFFAAFMSTISTQMNWGASYLTSDFYKRFLRPKATTKQLTRMSRMLSIVVLLAGGVTAVIMRLFGLSVDEAWKLLAALGAGTGAVYMLRWFWWRINAWSEIVGMVASLVVFVFVAQWVAPESTDGFFEQTRLAIKQHSEYQMALVAAITIPTWLLATLLTPAERLETLDRFYRRVRPAGPGWSPIARQATDVVTDRHLGRSILAAFTAAMLVYFTIPLVGQIIMKDYVSAAICAFGAVVSAVVTMILARPLLVQNTS